MQKPVGLRYPRSVVSSCSHLQPHSLRTCRTADRWRIAV